MPKLFDNLDTAKHALDHPRFAITDALETQWKVYEKYADSNYRVDLNNCVEELAESADDDIQCRKRCLDKFMQRFWELHVAVSLLDIPVPLLRRDERDQAGPDSIFKSGDSLCCIEAIVPNAGEGADRVPDLKTGGVYSVPDLEIQLRYTSALYTKLVQRNKRVDSGIVDERSPYLVAINGSRVPSAKLDYDPPRIVRCLFGIGPPAVDINVQTMEWGDWFLTAREKLPRSLADDVPANAFMSQEFKKISGVLFSTSDPWNFYGSFSSQVFLVENPNADVPVPPELKAHFGRWEYAGRKVVWHEPGS
jgi:type I restriction enzyme S subunit